LLGQAVWAQAMDEVASNAAAATPPMMCRRFNFEIMRVSFKNVIPE